MRSDFVYAPCPKGLRNDKHLCHCSSLYHAHNNENQKSVLEPIKHIIINLKVPFKVLKENEKAQLSFFLIKKNRRVIEITEANLHAEHYFVFYFKWGERQGHTLIQFLFYSCIFSMSIISTVFQKLNTPTSKNLFISLSNAFFQPLNGKYSNIYVAFAVFIIYLCFL